MKELELLQEKLQQLLKHHNAVQLDLERLRKTNEKQNAIIEKQKLDIEEVKRALTQKSVAFSANGFNDDKESLKQHLDLVIREIEKNIESL